MTRNKNRIILFSSFRHTLSYLETKLRSRNYRVAQINGSIKDDDRGALRERFELDRNDPDALDILLFTEVGSEGLDYQFCDTMINYDLSWNPMRIEQRIGRIDRRGQKSEAVNIYNIITADTVDADIYSRCLMRIGVFERSIGECEEVLGAIGAQIEQILRLLKKSGVPNWNRWQITRFTVCSSSVSLKMRSRRCSALIYQIIPQRRKSKMQRALGFLQATFNSYRRQHSKRYI